MFSWSTHKNLLYMTILNNWQLSCTPSYLLGWVWASWFCQIWFFDRIYNFVYSALLNTYFPLLWCYSLCLWKSDRHTILALGLQILLPQLSSAGPGSCGEILASLLVLHSSVRVSFFSQLSSVGPKSYVELLASFLVFHSSGRVSFSSQVSSAGPGSCGELLASLLMFPSSPHVDRGENYWLPFWSSIPQIESPSPPSCFQ